jgi:hypothetical protein
LAQPFWPLVSARWSFIKAVRLFLRAHEEGETIFIQQGEEGADDDGSRQGQLPGRALCCGCVPGERCCLFLFAATRPNATVSRGWIFKELLRKELRFI